MNFFITWIALMFMFVLGWYLGCAMPLGCVIW